MIRCPKAEEMFVKHFYRKIRRRAKTRASDEKILQLAQGIWDGQLTIKQAIAAANRYRPRTASLFNAGGLEL